MKFLKYIFFPIFIFCVIGNSGLQAQGFVTTWKTDNRGISNNDQIRIPTTGTGYNYTVDWGDGSTATTHTATTTHTYAMAGTYTVTITGAFPRIFFNGGGDRRKLLTVQQWGDISWRNMARAFDGCENLTMPAADAPDLTRVTDMSYMLFDASSFNGDMSSWNVANVTNMEKMFSGASSFNQNISSWDVSKVFSMNLMFQSATSFNGDISSWNVSRVANMFFMFSEASSFNQDLSTWNVSKVTSMSSMFSEASSFNQDISTWNVSRVTNMRAMFQDASSFNQDISTWNVSNVTIMMNMLDNSGLSKTNYDNLLTGWVTLPSLQNSVNLGAIGINYCTGTADRDILIGTHGWMIRDAGRSCSVATDITAFSFPAQTGAAVIDRGTVVVQVRPGTLLTALVPAISVSSGATIAPASGAAQNFSNDVVYTVTAQDGSTTQGWTVTVTEENAAPADIALSNNSIGENNAVNDVIGVLSATDANRSDTHTYSLVAGTGDTDNASFSISGSNLVAAEVFDHETKSAYSVRIATDDGNGGMFEKAFALTVNNVPDLPQIITFGELAARTFGDGTFNLAATTDFGGLPVSYSSSVPSVASVSGSTVTIVGAGTTDITASQAGDADYAAATVVVRTLVVNKANQTITLTPVDDKVTTDAPFDVAASSTSGLPVTLTVSSGPATISETTLTLAGTEGTVTITANQAGTSNYHAATPVEESFDVTLLPKQAQAIAFNALAARTFGDGIFNLAATASSTLNVSYSSSDPLVATIAGNTVTIEGAGTTDITASQAGDADYAAATVVVRTLVVNKANQTITLTPVDDKVTTDAAFEVAASSTSGLPITFTVNGAATISATTLTLAGTEGTVTITASQAGTPNYHAATPVEESFDVTLLPKQAQAIAFNALAARTFGDGIFNLAATASSTLNVSYSSSDPLVATIAGNTVTIEGAGTTTITASQAGDINYTAAMDVAQNLVVNQADQTIDFGTLSAVTFGGADFDPGATASSRLAVSYTSSDPSVATIAGNTVTIEGAGTTTITASQAGDINYTAAMDVAQNLVVNQADQTIDFGTLSAVTFGGADFDPGATASSRLAVSYSSSDPLVASIAGNMVTIEGAGTATITASQAGDDDYAAATVVAQNLVVNKADQTIGFNAPAAVTFGGADFDPGATASSRLAVSYTSSDVSVASVSGSTVTIVGAGTTDITASQAGDADYAAATVVVRTLVVNKANQTITLTPVTDKVTTDAAFEVAASSTSGLPITLTVSSGPATISETTLTLVGTEGTVTITASQAGTSNYHAATPVEESFDVTLLPKQAQAIAFNALAARTFGDGIFNLAATASSTLNVSYSSSDPLVASIAGSTVTIEGAGTTTITASQAGDINYTAAMDVAQNLVVNQADQTIDFGTLSAVTFGGADFDPGATASSRLAVSYSSSDPLVASIAGNMVTIEGAGTATITASQAGDDDYAAATVVAQNLVVNKADQTIDFGTLSAVTFGGADFDPGATSSSTLNVSYSSSDPSVASIAGNMVTIEGAGTATITASQAGDINYTGAMDVAQNLVVNQADQTIDFGTLSAVTFGGADFDPGATSSSTLNVSYSSSDPSVASIAGNMVTIEGAGTATITASQAGDDDYAAATVVAQDLVVNRADQTIDLAPVSTKGTIDAPFDVAVSSTSGLPVTLTVIGPATISATTLTLTGDLGTVTITANQAGNSNYHVASSVAQSFDVVTKQAQTITFGALAAMTFGGASFNLTATASSTLNVSYSSSDPLVATIAGNTVTIEGAGTTTITASQVGDINYTGAMDVAQNLVVNQADQTIDFGTLSAVTFGGADFDPGATSSSTLNVSYSSSDPLVASIAGNMVTIEGAGTATITASQAGDDDYAAATVVAQDLVVNKADQTIDFGTLSAVTFGGADFDPGATASSRLAVSYTSSDISVASVSGSTVTIVGAGTTDITASQAGDADYAAATVVVRTLVVNKANQTITLTPVTDKVTTDAPFEVAASSTSTLPITFTVNGPATISGTTLTLEGTEGTVTITASQAGNDNYNAAPPAEESFDVTLLPKQAQAIAFNALAARTFGDGIFNLAATASSTLNVSYSSSDPLVATIAGSTVTIVGAGITTITASQAGDIDYIAATDVAQSLVVDKANQTIGFNALSAVTFGGADFDPGATASSGLAVSYSSSDPLVATIAGSTVTIVGAGTTDITASQAGDDDYAAATVVAQDLVVNRADQTIDLAPVSTKGTIDAPFDVAVSSTSGLPVTLTVSGPATISETTLTLAGTLGTVTITANQAGNSNYHVASSVAQSFDVVTKQAQTITFGALAAMTFGGASFNLTATASSTLNVSYMSSDPLVASIAGNMVTIVGAGTTIITASQAGDINYIAAPDVAQNLVVNKADQTIGFDALAAVTFGGADFNLAATASSTLPVSYSSSDASVASIAGSMVTIVGTGTTTITASQAGDDDYAAATVVAQNLVVNRADQTIDLAPVSTKGTIDAPFDVAVSSTSGLPVTLTVSGPATISETTLTLTGTEGTVTITADQAGNSNYNAAPSVVQSFEVVTKQAQTITFGALAAMTFGGASFNLTATSSSTLNVSYSSSDPLVASIAGNMVTIEGAGTATITASQAGDDDYAAATVVAQNLVVNKADQTIGFNAPAAVTFGGADFDPGATSSSGLAVSYSSSDPLVASIAGNMVTIEGAGIATITASQAGDDDYAAATVVAQNLVVNQADQTITLTPVADKVTADAPFDVVASSTSRLPVTFTVSGPVTISGTTLTLTGTEGIVTITASQAGNDNYHAASSVEESFDVTLLPKQAQAIAFNALAAVTFGGADFDPGATSSSGLAVSYSSSDPLVATIAGSTVTIEGAGTTTITASQAGDINYTGAMDVAQNLVVNQADQTITLTPVADKVTADAPFDVAASSTSGLTITLTVNGPATISATTLTLEGTEGTVTITASQAGNDNYHAATTVDVDFEVTRQAQTITFGALADVTSGGASFNLTATASSGLAVSYSSSDPSVASITGSTVTIVGAGITDITASQAGDADYAAATDVAQRLEVNMKTVTGLEEEAPANKIILYPIPANNTIYIDMGNQKLLEMTVTDLNGKQLTVHAQDSRLDISSLKEGYYILRITTDQGVFSQKIIKQ